MRLRSLVLAIGILVAGTSSPVSAAQESCEQWEGLAQQVGWKPMHIEMLSMVMWRESRCQPTSIGRNKRADGTVWSQDLGLLQINDYSWRRWLRDQGVIKTDRDLFKPRVNLEAGLLIFQYGQERHGNGWIAWKATSGYRKAGK